MGKAPTTSVHLASGNAINKTLWETVCACCRSGDYYGAWVLLEKEAARGAADVVPPRLLTAFVLLKSGDVKGAVRVLQDMRKQDPRDGTASYFLSLAYREQNMRLSLLFLDVALRAPSLKVSRQLASQEREGLKKALGKWLRERATSPMVSEFAAWVTMVVASDNASEDTKEWARDALHKAHQARRGFRPPERRQEVDVPEATSVGSTPIPATRRPTRSPVRTPITKAAVATLTPSSSTPSGRPPARSQAVVPPAKEPTPAPTAPTLALARSQAFVPSVKVPTSAPTALTPTRSRETARKSPSPNQVEGPVVLNPSVPARKCRKCGVAMEMRKVGTGGPYKWCCPTFCPSSELPSRKELRALDLPVPRHPHRTQATRRPRNAEQTSQGRRVTTVIVVGNREYTVECTARRRRQTYDYYNDPG